MKKFLLILGLLVIIAIPIVIYFVYDFDSDANIPSDNLDTNEPEKTDKITKMLDNMSVEEKVGQMFMVRVPKENADKRVSEYHLGGYIMFGRDFDNKTKEEVINNIASWQSAADIPMLIGVDEEGGTVNRISTNTEFRSEPFKSSQELYAEGGFDLIYEDTIDKANFLKSFGINVNFAPVVDVSTNSADYIYKRSFGKDAKETATYVGKMVDYANEVGISSCLKHFPGYGNNSDTHTGSAIDNRSYESFLESDFLPFESGIQEKVPMVLVSHNIMMAVDSKYPSSLSQKVISILRDELDFSGIVITDDLAMGAIDQYRNQACVTCLAVNAGNDVMIVSDFQDAYQELMAAVENKEVSIKKINKAVKRILAWKLAYHMIDSNVDN